MLLVPLSTRLGIPVSICHLLAGSKARGWQSHNVILSLGVTGKPLDLLINLLGTPFKN
jgi:hypothetical protein